MFRCVNIQAGEILGVAGVAGNGQRELAEVVMGIQPVTNGTMQFNGEDITLLSTKERIARGFVYIPEDRLADGFLNKASVAHNLILGYHHLPPYSKNGIISWKHVNDSSKVNDLRIPDQDHRSGRNWRQSIGRKHSACDDRPGIFATIQIDGRA